MRFFSKGLCILVLMAAGAISWGQQAELHKLSLHLHDYVTTKVAQMGSVGILLMDADTGREVYDYRAGEALVPASCLKLLTTAAALWVLGEEFSYHTSLYYQGELEGKRLQGDLIVVGNGDPTLSGRFEEDKKDVVAPLRRWAEELRQRGIKNIEGNIIGDDDFFDDDYFGRGWYPRERGEWYCAEISALSFNDNCVDMWWKGRGPGKKAHVRLNPPTSYVELVNEVVSVREKGEYEVSYARGDKSNRIVASGRISTGEEHYDWATVYNPTRYFVTVLRDVFDQEGIKVKGKVYDIDEYPDAEKLREGREKLLDHQSPPLPEIIRVINMKSQNFYADQLLKTLGKLKREEGSFREGAQVVVDFLREHNVNENGTLMIDGSGLSYLNRASARQLARLLYFVYRSPHQKVYFSTLPQGGSSGTLSDRFKADERSRKLGKNVWGKTGWLGKVRSMAGVVKNQVGKSFVYAIIVNEFEAPPSEVIEFIDELVLKVAESRIY